MCVSGCSKPGAGSVKSSLGSGVVVVASMATSNLLRWRTPEMCLDASWRRGIASAELYFMVSALLPGASRSAANQNSSSAPMILVWGGAAKRYSGISPWVKMGQATPCRAGCDGRRTAELEFSGVVRGAYGCLQDKGRCKLGLACRRTTNKNAPTQSSQPTRRPHINPRAANRGKTAKSSVGLVI